MIGWRNFTQTILLGRLVSKTFEGLFHHLAKLIYPCIAVRAVWRLDHANGLNGRIDTVNRLPFVTKRLKYFFKI